MESMESNQNESLLKLVCGYSFESEIEIDMILQHIANSLEKIINEIIVLPSLEDDRLSLYGPYLGRSLLELSLMALLGRIDPFKIILMKRKQEQSDYELGKPHSSAIRWQGDVVDKAVSDLWAEKSLNSPTRAILGAYQIELVMIKSAQRIFDEGNEQTIGEWYTELTQTDAKGLVEKLKSRINTIYSSLSKGVHHELLIPHESVMDRDTVLTLINDTLFIVGTLGLLVSRIPYAYQKCPQDESFMHYKNVKGLEVI